MDFGMIASAAVNALREQIPDVSPLDAVSMTEGRVDVLASRLLQRMANGTGDPALMAVYEKARPVVDTVIMQTMGPKQAGRRSKR